MANCLDVVKSNLESKSIERKRRNKKRVIGIAILAAVITATIVLSKNSITFYQMYNAETISDEDLEKCFDHVHNIYAKKTIWKFKDEWFVGTWRSPEDSTWYFARTKGGITYNFPDDQMANTSMGSISNKANVDVDLDGILYMYGENGVDLSSANKLLKFKPISKKKVKVYSYKNGNTYELCCQ